MTVLWITNIPVGKMAKKLCTSGGVWMDALLEDLSKTDENKYVISTPWKTSNVEVFQDGQISYYLLPGGIPSKYKRKKEDAINDWELIYKNEKPDVVLVWGTEWSFAITALELAKQKHIPACVYIQGIIRAIAKYATGGASLGTMIRYITLRDIYRRQLWINQAKWFEKKIPNEKQLISLAGNVVIENQWAEMYCTAISPTVNSYKIPLNINREFFNHEWDASSIERHSIVCNAWGATYKGLHILLRALALVKKKYPDVKLYVPGKANAIKPNIVLRQRVPGYYAYIYDLINNTELKESVIFTGYLNPSELATRLEKSNVFVLCSAIENHSSSLKEAMVVGTPSIATMVGGIPEYHIGNQDGFLYRFEDYECLAGYICQLFENNELCMRFSENARKKAREISASDITRMIENMYEDLINKNK